MRKSTYLKLVEYQTEQSARHLNEVRSIHTEMRGYKHDFHNHLQTLKSQLKNGDVERALAYINELDEKLITVDTLLKTGNVSLDAILSAKIAQAKAENIAVTVKANIPDKLTISDVELSIVIGNLLDNAIEACCTIPDTAALLFNSGCPEPISNVAAASSESTATAGMEDGDMPNRFIRIYIGMKGKMLYFSMLNSAGKKQKKIGTRFATKKAGVHGFGLRRAEAILQEKGGWCKYNSEDGAFTSEFLVPAVE